MEKPTDLIPKKVWLETRFNAVCLAIAAKYDALEPIPEEWVQEYNWLITVVEKPRENGE